MINDQHARSIEGQEHQFISYTGEVTVGFLQLDRKSRIWYLIPSANAPARGVGIGQDAEFGKPVDLNSLELLEQEIDDMESYDSKISFYSHPEVILIVIGAGASYDISGQKGFKLPMTKDWFAK